MAFAAGFVTSIALAGLAWLAISYWPGSTEPSADKLTIARAVKITPLAVEEEKTKAPLAPPPVSVPASTTPVEPDARQAAAKEPVAPRPVPATSETRVAPSIAEKRPAQTAEKPADSTPQTLARVPDPPAAAPSAFEEETASEAARAKAAALSSQPPAVPDVVTALPPPHVAHKRRVAKEAKLPTPPPLFATPVPGAQQKQAPAANPGASILGAETPFSYVWQQQPLSMPSVGRN